MIGANGPIEGNDACLNNNNNSPCEIRPFEARYAPNDMNQRVYTNNVGVCELQSMSAREVRAPCSNSGEVLCQELCDDAYQYLDYTAQRQVRDGY